MFQISRQIKFCYGHRLMNYRGKCRHLHGHNGRLIITLEASGLDDRGMVLDFSEITRVVSSWIDDHLDHRMVLAEDDQIVKILTDFGEPMFLMNVNPTAENIAAYFHTELSAQLNSPGIRVHAVTLWETERACVRYVEDQS